MKRCDWVTNDLLLDYHDHEWGQKTTNPRTLFECLALEIMQGGLAWSLILKRQTDLRAAFQGFYPEQLADLSPASVEALLQDPRTIHHHRKIDAILHNATVIARMNEPFNHYLDRIVLPIAPDETALIKRTVKQMKADGFTYIGPKTINSFLEATGYLHHHDPECDWYREGIDTVSPY
ncbi:MAG: DNA-3-methyladenine glycosylase I [Aerococcus sp.]|nr:DNA-3-methyladenine glycosylase I [Aerococcus sp.]